MIDRDAATYDPIADDYQRWVASADMLEDETFTDLLGCVNHQRVLALACGQGREARLLARAGATVTGVDLSERLLEHARSYEEHEPLGITYVRDDAQTLTTLQDASFDGAVCYLALMDIPDLRATVTSLARVIAWGGWLVLAVTHPCFKPPVAGELLDHRDGRTSRMGCRILRGGTVRSPGSAPRCATRHHPPPDAQYISERTDRGRIGDRAGGRTRQTGPTSTGVARGSGDAVSPVSPPAGRSWHVM